MEKCLICNKRFNNKRGLANHIRTHNMTPTQYKKMFDKELWKYKVEGVDFVKCPICSERMSTLVQHMKKVHKLSDKEIYSLDCPLISEKLSEELSQAQIEVWENSPERLAELSKRTSKMMTERANNPEYQEKLLKARIDAGVYSDIGQKRNQHLIDKFDNYDDYLSELVRRLDKTAKQYRASDSYGDVMYRSSWEYKLSQILDDLNVIYKYEPFWIKYYNPSKERIARYNPDFYIESKNLILEVKPYHLILEEVNQAKKKAVLDKRYNFEFITESQLNFKYISSLVI